MHTPKVAPVEERTKQHYRELLAPIYKWMLGDFPSALERARAELRELGVGAARTGARALDLGAGLGLQTIPLTELGYDVTAVDSSEALLAELSRACPSVHVVRDDLTNASAFGSGTYDVIVCMGDTLTHLVSAKQVRTLVDAAISCMAPGGLLLFTFRDYTGPAPSRANRFILVRADAGRILTCHLDYGSERVVVTDIVHELSAGTWSLRSSHYEKLRLAPAFVALELTRRGLFIDRCDSIAGRVSIVARRPPTL